MMTDAMRTLLLALIALPLLAVEPNPEGAGMDPDRLARIPARLQEFVDQGTSAGFVSLVARHGEVAAFDAVGYQDLHKKTPMRTDSIHQVMSCTKPITVAGLMVLVDEGRVALTDPVEKYLPEFKNPRLNPCGPGGAGYHCASRPPKRLVQIRDLMTHTSGIAAEPPADFPRYTSTLAEVVAAGAREPMLSDPGTRWSYNNLGIATLGRIIEVVSGQSFEDFMAERIFEPLDMPDTTFFPPVEKMDRVASVYSFTDGKLVPYQRDPPRAQWKNPLPEGGLYSTAVDLAHFLRDEGDVQHRRRVLTDLARRTAEMHNAGFTDGDFHARNLLVGPTGRVWNVDCGRQVLRTGTAALGAAHVDDLASVDIALRRFATAEERREALLTYGQSRGLPEAESLSLIDRIAGRREEILRDDDPRLPASPNE